MQSICKQVKGIVSDRQTTPSALISRTESLLNELNVAERKFGIVKRFQQDYQLDATVAETIKSGDVDEAFFEALQRVHTVHENCRSLLHTHHQRAGLELLDSMSSYEETAYERLCKCAVAINASPSTGNLQQACNKQTVLLKF
jgi:conserved oligomeric Golgi complex subunit 6